MRKTLILLILFAFTLAGCFSNKKLVKSSKFEPVELSRENLVGHYHNKSIKYPDARLWNILADNKSFKGYDSRTSEDAIVKIELINSDQLIASLILNDSVTDKMSFEGKIIDRHFSLKKKLMLIPIPALLFHRERKTILGNDKDKNLVVTRGYKNAGWFLFMASDFGGVSSYNFQRIEE